MVSGHNYQSRLPTIRSAQWPATRAGRHISSRFPDSPIAVFAPSGQFQRYMGTGLEIGRAEGISVDADGCIWLADSVNHVCHKLGPSGELLLTLGSFEEPSDTGVDTNYDFGVSRFSTVRRRGGPLNGPTNLAIAPTGCLYVADGHWNCAVHKFREDGTLLESCDRRVTERVNSSS